GPDARVEEQHELACRPGRSDHDVAGGRPTRRLLELGVRHRPTVTDDRVQTRIVGARWGPGSAPSARPPTGSRLRTTRTSGTRRRTGSPRSRSTVPRFTTPSGRRR